MYLQQALIFNALNLPSILTTEKASGNTYLWWGAMGGVFGRNNAHVFLGGYFKKEGAYYRFREEVFSVPKGCIQWG